MEYNVIALLTSKANVPYDDEDCYKMHSIQIPPLDSGTIK